MNRPLTQDEIEKALADLPGWTHENDALAKTFTLEHFASALSFIVRMGMECEKMDHHPHLTNVWNKVSLRLMSHDAGDKVTDKDVQLARAIQHFSWVG